MSSAPFKVRAIYEYSSPHDDDLSFPNSQIITVTAEEDDDWYSGEYVDSSGRKCKGIFPRNFVEKYEPEVPSRPIRPTRPKKDTETSTVGSVDAPPAVETQNLSESVLAGKEPREPPERPTGDSSQRLGISASPPSSQLPTPQPPADTASKATEQPQVKPAGKPASHPASEPPGGGSFRDRIAAFNKPAAPPISPLNPSTQGTSSSTSFIKKPFVAPPPSKNAYVPPPREAPSAKAYRRDMESQLNEAAEDSEASLPVPGEKVEATGDEQPKPTTLKERIALLQKQQLEQAARHAEAAQKKEKPKRPPKKRTESQEETEISEIPPDADPQRSNVSEAAGKKSVDFVDDESEPLGARGSFQQSSVAQMATPPPPSRELMSDTNDADYSGAGDTEEAYDTSTSREDDREKAKGTEITGTHTATGDFRAEASEEEAEGEENDGVDAELKRRMEIRERMAKMSGGMGLMGMFGPAGGMPPPGKKAKAGGETHRSVSNPQEQAEVVEHATPVPEPSDGDDTDLPAPPKRSSTDRLPPPLPQGRAVPVPPPQRSRTPPPSMSEERSARDVPSSPSQGRAAPPPPPRMSLPLSPGELSDDEMSFQGSLQSPGNATSDIPPSRPVGLPPVSTAPPIPTTRPGREELSYNQSPPTSPTIKNKRSSRGPPPLPPTSPTAAPPTHQSRALPPPPPGQPPSRKSTSQSRNLARTSKEESADASEDEGTEYDGDYDTDIASSAKHKDALKSHARDSSLDEDRPEEQTDPKGSTNPSGRGPPPLPSVSAPRDVPPPPPAQITKQGRKSGDMPRGAPPPVPPPIPPPREAAPEDNDPGDDDFQQNPAQGVALSPRPNQTFTHNVQPPHPPEEAEEDDLYNPSPRLARLPTLSAQAPPSPAVPQLQQPLQTASGQSADKAKAQNAIRRSIEVSRPSSEHGFIATDIELASSSQWYAQTPDIPPPSLRQRNDIRFEIESSSSSKRGGKITVSKDVYILYMDYSQTIISASFDPSDPNNANLEQRHERPPPPPRQDQLEAASAQFGTRLVSAVATKANTTVGDGSPHALVLDLLSPLSNSVLLPVGTRAYGAPVYANLANASTQQFDEIRPGDIVTFRNAKFAGHKGGLHTKYSMEVGKPDHVAVVADWDGTKKKIRVWEQRGKEKDEGKRGGVPPAKVKEEGYRVGDLKSGEVRVWRVMGRGWVGWESGK